MDIKIELYKIFNIVAGEKSFSKAAAKLFMTQSAVSQAIKNLENTLDTVLFIRSPKGIELTEAGTILYRYTSSAMEILETSILRLDALKNLEEGELKIGASDSITSHFLLQYLESFHKIYPNVKIKIINRVTNKTIELLKSGKIDIAFINMPIEIDNIEVIKCIDIHDTFVAGNGFKNYKNKVFTREEISKLPLILLEKKSNSRMFVENCFIESGLNLTASIELGAHDLLLELAKINLGISCVTKEFAKDYLNNNDLFELKQKEPLPKRAIGLCYSKALPITPTMQKFMEFVRFGNVSKKRTLRFIF